MFFFDENLQRDNEDITNYHQVWQNSNFGPVQDCTLHVILKDVQLDHTSPAADGRLAEAEGEDKSAKSPMRSELSTVNNQDHA